MTLCVGIYFVFSIIIITSAFVYHFEVGAITYHIMFNYNCVKIIIACLVSSNKNKRDIKCDQGVSSDCVI